MWRSLIILVVGIPFASTQTSYLTLYNESTIRKYLQRSALNQDVSERCRRGLQMVAPYFDQYDTIKDQRQFFTDAYTSGESSEVDGRDLDRWMYRSFECLKTSGDTAFSRSEHPFSFCIGYNMEKENQMNNTAYGICIPSVCYEDSSELLYKWRRMTSEATDLLDYTFCMKSRYDKQWYQKFTPLFETGINTAFLGLVAVATLYHIRYGEQSNSIAVGAFLAFSAKKNLKKLVTLPKDPHSTITCMFGIRFLSMVWTLIGHSFTVAQFYMKNVDEFKDEMVNPFYNQWITNFTLSVDTFFVLSATLTAYLWFKKQHDSPRYSEVTWTSWNYWLRYYRHRLIRLWPAYIYALICISARMAVQHYHPMWPPGDPAVQCPKYGWQNILFVNSLLDNRCMSWTWYIGTEFIFYLLSPLFLLSLRNSPLKGILLSFCVIAASSGLNVIAMLSYNFPPTQMLWKQPHIFNPDYMQQHHVMYIRPEYRIGPYIVGLLLGCYLANIHKTRVQIRPSLWIQITGWSLAGCALFWVIFGIYPALQGWNWSVYHLVYGCLHRTIFAISIAWLIYACHIGIGGIVNLILSWKILLPLSSLCYSVYLFHFPFLLFTYLQAPFPIVFVSKWMLFAHCIVQLILSYIFGLVCSLLSELPALNLERLIFKTDRKVPLQPIRPLDCEEHLKAAEAK